MKSKYIDGYEGEGEVFIYCADDDTNGLLIWEGYFEFLLSSCYYQDFPNGGLLEAYYNCNGFYDNSPWKIKDISIIIEELKHFSVEKCETTSKKNIDVITELKNDLMLFFKKAILEKKEVLIEYN